MQRWRQRQAAAAAAYASAIAKFGNRRGWRFPEAAAALLLVASLPVPAADSLHGADLYRRHCASCHGPGGRPQLPGAPDFTQPTALLKADAALATTIRSGRGAMPGYAGQLREREILDVVAHLRTLR